MLVSVLEAATRSRVGCFFFQETSVFFRISLWRWGFGCFPPHYSKGIFQRWWLRMLGSVRVHRGDLHCKCGVVGAVCAGPLWVGCMPWMREAGWGCWNRNYFKLPKIDLYLRRFGWPPGSKLTGSQQGTPALAGPELHKPHPDTPRNFDHSCNRYYSLDCEPRGDGKLKKCPWWASGDRKRLLVCVFCLKYWSLWYFLLADAWFQSSISPASPNTLSITSTFEAV